MSGLQGVGDWGRSVRRAPGGPTAIPGRGSMRLALGWDSLQPRTNRPDMRAFLILLIRIVVSLALLYLALRGINFAAIRVRLSQISVGWILLAVLIALMQIFAGALRWQAISAL